jgi:hypothetical protein
MRDPGAAEFRRRRARVANGAGVEQALREHRGFRGDVVLVHQRAGSDRVAFHRHFVLDRERQTFQRAQPRTLAHVFRLRLFRLLEGALVEGRRERVDDRLHRFRALDDGLHQLDRR